MVIEDVVSIINGCNHLSTQWIVFPTGCKMLIFRHLVNDIPVVATNEKLDLMKVDVFILISHLKGVHVFASMWV